MPLDPEIAVLLDRQKDLPPRSSLDVEQTRAMMRRMSALAGDAPALTRVEDTLIDGSIHAREYSPSLAGGLPLVVFLHGGRFFSGDLESHDTTCRLLAEASGCRVLAVDYRLAPEHRFPAAFDDACRVLAAALRQPVAVGVAGDSVGANLAAGAALACRGSKLACQLLIYPMLDATRSLPSHREFAAGYGPGSADMARGWREYLGDCADPRDPRASPIFAEDLSGAAPAFVMTAEYDSLRDEGEAYAQQLAGAGVSVVLRRYEGMIHGFFGMGSVVHTARDAMDDAAAFLRGKLG